MIRLTKMTDYALVLLALMARRDDNAPFASRDLAEATGIPLPMVSKVLKTLVREDFLRSTRGAHGGYTLARPPAQISVALLIEALEGPVALTECADHTDSQCSLEQGCPISSPLRRINHVVIETLAGITLEELAEPDGVRLARRWKGLAEGDESTAAIDPVSCACHEDAKLDSITSPE